MRLKLVVIASLLAAVVGAGSCIALVLTVFSRHALSSPGLLVASTFLLPLAAIIFASIFVYRHTARRRRLQAFLTVILATLLTISIFVVTSILTTDRRRLIADCRLPIFDLLLTSNRQLAIGNRQLDRI